MTGLEFKINAYKALKNICPKNQRSQNPTLDGQIGSLAIFITL